ncbi:MAG TPA: hypothetical protein VF507_08700, partial [Pyrinomonadaceae bacterium]
MSRQPPRLSSAFFLFILMSALIAAPSSAVAQVPQQQSPGNDAKDVRGIWQGALEVSGIRLRLVLKIKG